MIIVRVRVAITVMTGKRSNTGGKGEGRRVRGEEQAKGGAGTERGG